MCKYEKRQVRVRALVFARKWEWEGVSRKGTYDRKRGNMRRRIKIERVSTVSIIVASALAILFAFICALGLKEFNVLQVSTERYITCEAAAKQLKEGSDYLTEQVRLYVLTGEAKYREQYLEEVNVTKRREKALEEPAF